MRTPSIIMKVIKRGGNRGIAFIYLALLLVVLLAFVALAIDIGYMYVTKTELQNAADSAALAGASKLKYIGSVGADPNDLQQIAARTEAIAFAALNKATKLSIAINNNNSNVLSDDNDITVGHWNMAFNSYSANKPPINAIQVRTRRTDNSPGGPVSLFIGRVFGQDKMGVVADAIAALPVRANNFISFCTETCDDIDGDPTTNDPVSTDPANPTILNPAKVYNTRPGTLGTNSFAWTSLLNPVSSANDISPLICQESPNEDVCNKPIWTTQGQVTSLLKNLESVFNDPNYDRENKEFSGSRVTAWWVIVPVTLVCNPGNQPEPHNVVKYALIRIISACDTGGGNPCRPYRSTPCTNPGDIVIDRIACIDCANLSDISGLRTVLVR